MVREGDSHLLLPRAGFPPGSVVCGWSSKPPACALPAPWGCDGHCWITALSTSHFLSCDQGTESIGRPSSTLCVKVTRISLPQRAKQHVPGAGKHRTQEGALARVLDLVPREGQVLKALRSLLCQDSPHLARRLSLHPDGASVGQDDIPSEHL